MNKAVRTILVSLFFATLFLAGVNLFVPNIGAKTQTFSVTEFRQEITEGNVSSANWQGNTISGDLKLKEGQKTADRYTARVTTNETPAGAELGTFMSQNGIKYSYVDPLVSAGTAQFIMFLLPTVILIAVMYFLFVRSSQQNGNAAMNFGKSKARRASETSIKITFDDVAGIDEAKQELSEIVDFLKSTKKYVALGAKIPKGVLLTGPPGVGKTHLARAIAGEAGVPFFHISGSDFVEMFVGVGAARVRDLFETAKAHRPCIIFVDEIDAVGRQRGAGMGGGHDEREQTLNQLLVEMDGFDANMGVIMIAATNRPDVLDPALLRPGRFDRQVVVDAPDAKGREAILKIHAKGKPFESDVNLTIVAKRTPGFSGADLANALNESALLAARYNKLKIGMAEIEEALDRVMVGPARKSRVMIAKDRELTAFHEAGHAIVGELLEHCDPIHKVTILPRGMAMGITWSLPDTEKMSVSRSELMDDIAMTLGGLVAEEVVFGERWTGASSDLERVTRIARAMICEFGMSDKLGTLAIGRRSGNPFLGRGGMEDRNYSEDVAKMIDEEVRRFVEDAHHRATEILKSNRETLDRVVQALLERETIDRDEFLALMKGEALPPLEQTPSEGGGHTAPIEETKEESSRVNPQSPRLEPGTA